MKTVVKLALSVSLVGTLLLIAALGPVAAADKDKDKKGKEKAAAAAAAKDEPRGLSPKERERQRRALEKELDRPFKKWLDEDVAYVITDEERAAFKRLGTADEREQFI